MAKSATLSRFGGLLRDGSSPAAMAGLDVSGFKNKLINPRFMVNSRVAGSAFLSDRWLLSQAGGTTQAGSVASASVAGRTKSVARIQVGGSGQTAVSNGVFLQRMEFPELLTGRHTISFEAWCASGNRNITVELQQFLGTGGSAVTYATPQKIAITNVPTRYFLTFDIPSTEGKTLTANRYLALTFWFSAGSDFNSRSVNLGIQTGDFYIGDPQLEAGDFATDMDNRFFAVEELLCARYCAVFDCEAGGAYPTASGGAYGFCRVYFPVPMRAVPTIFVGNGNAVNLNSSQFSETTRRGTSYRVLQGGSAGNFYGTVIGNIAEAEIA